MAARAERRLQALERQRAAAKRLQESEVSGALKLMSTEHLRSLRSLLVNQEQQPEYTPTDAERAALVRWQELIEG